jgi:hypothetical protein
MLPQDAVILMHLLTPGCSAEEVHTLVQRLRNYVITVA